MVINKPIGLFWFSSLYLSTYNSRFTADTRSRLVTLPLLFDLKRPVMVEDETVGKETNALAARFLLIRATQGETRASSFSPKKVHSNNSPL